MCKYLVFSGSSLERELRSWRAGVATSSKRSRLTNEGNSDICLARCVIEPDRPWATLVMQRGSSTNRWPSLRVPAPSALGILLKVQSASRQLRQNVPFPTSIVAWCVKTTAPPIRGHSASCALTGEYVDCLRNSHNGFGRICNTREPWFSPADSAHSWGGKLCVSLWMYRSSSGGGMPTVFTNKVKDAVMTLASWGPLCLRVPVHQKERKSASGFPLHNFLT